MTQHSKAQHSRTLYNAVSKYSIAATVIPAGRRGGWSMWHYMGCYSLAVRQVLQHCPTRRFVSGAYQSNRALRVRLLAFLPSCIVYPHVAILGFSTILQPPAVQAAACQRSPSVHTAATLIIPTHAVNPCHCLTSSAVSSLS